MADELEEPSHMKLVLPCPAKLNLFLHINGRRQDGYHELQTVFQLLDYGDDICIENNTNDTVTLKTPVPGVPESKNLVMKAAMLLRNHADKRLGASISLNKRLPLGGGIGGGSSDAASTLVGLNHLWNLKLSTSVLAGLGRQLGADVPVFVRGKSSWAEGVGEKLTPLELEQRYFVVLAPDCHISTAAVFSHKDLTRDTLAITVAAFLERGGKNDCQKLVERLFPQVRDAVEWLSQFGPTQLTGTGACIFAPFPSREAAEAVFAKRPENLGGFVAKGVNESPLHRCLAEKSITGV